MSLTDAFLLDPYPFNVWIASRGDGAGSGTANDPWDVRTQARFDAVMSSLETLYPLGQVCVHLAASPRDTNGNLIPYQTNGFRVSDGTGWQVRPGLKLLGSGTDVTVLKLVNATSDSPYFAIGHALTKVVQSQTVPNAMDGVEVADLTIDCNADGSGVAGACGAVRLMGSHCRIRRIKVINWGTKSDNHPCHALSLIAALGYAESGTNFLLETVDSGIEGCIALLPSHNSKREAVALHVGGVEASNGVQGYGKSPFVRNNYVDGTSASGAQLPMVSGSGTWDGDRDLATFTCRTGRVHNRTSSQYVTIREPGASSLWNGYFPITPDANDPAIFTFPLEGGPEDATLLTCGTEIWGIAVSSCRGGIVEGNQIHNLWFGGPYVDALNTKEIIVRNNTYKNVVSGPYWRAGALGQAGSVTSASAASGTVTVETPYPHNLFAKEWIQMLSNGSSAGFFQVSRIVDAYNFEYQNSSAPGGTVTFKRVQGADKVVVEGNVIELADLDATEYAAPNLADSPDYLPIAILLSDEAVPSPAPPCVFGDVVIRNNKIRYLDGRMQDAPTGQPMAGTGVQVARAQNLLVQNNVVEIIPAHPLQNFRCAGANGGVKYFNNQTPTGVIVQGYEGELGFSYSELATEAEDAFILAYLER